MTIEQLNAKRSALISETKDRLHRLVLAVGKDDPQLRDIIRNELEMFSVLWVQLDKEYDLSTHTKN